MDDTRFIENLLSDRMERHYETFPLADLKAEYNEVEAGCRTALANLPQSDVEAVEKYLDWQLRKQEIENTGFYKAGLVDGYKLSLAILKC